MREISLSIKGKRALLANILYGTQSYRAIRPLWRDSLVVFNYHRIRGMSDSCNHFDEGVFGPDQELFRRQIRWLQSNADVISEADLLDHVKKGTALPAKCAMLTFDDGYRDNFDLAFPILKGLGVPALFFIPTSAIENQELGWWDLIAYLLKRTKLEKIRLLGHELDVSTAKKRHQSIRQVQEWMRRRKASETCSLIHDLSKACDVVLPEAALYSRELMSWDQIREMRSAGMSIGSHTHTHRVLSTLNVLEQLDEFKISKRILERELGAEVVSLAYPVGGNRDFLPETALLPKTCGYDLGFSFQTGFNRVKEMSPFEIRRISADMSVPLFCAALSIPPVFAVPRLPRIETDATPRQAPREMKSHWPISILATCTSLVGMALPLVLVRILPADELGAFKIFFLYLMLFPSFTLISGVSNGLSYWAGRGPQGVQAIRMSSFLFIGAAVLAFSALTVFRADLAHYMLISERLMALFSVSTLIGIASLFYDDAAIATGRIWVGAIFNSSFEVLRTAAILVTAVLTRDLEKIIFAHIGVQSLRMLTGYLLALRQGLIRLEWDSAVFWSVMRYAMPVSIAALFGLWLNYSDQIILSKSISAAEFALYSVCCLTVPPLLVLEASVTRVLIPDLSAAFSQGDLAHAAAFYKRSVHELSYFVFPAATGMIVFAAPILELLFTKRYVGGVHYLQMYAVWYLALVIPPDAVARARGQANWILSNFVSFSVLTLVSCLFLVRLFGPIGALSGLIITRLVSRSYTVYWIRRTTSWKFTDFLPLTGVARITAACLGLGLLCDMMKGLFASPLHWLAVAGPLFCAGYFLLCPLPSIAAKRKTATSHRKVLMLTPGLSIGGLERMILNLSQALKLNLAWEPNVVAYDFSRSDSPDTDLIRDFEAAGIPVMSERKPPRFSLRTASGIASKARREGVTVIHSHDLGALIYGAIAKCLLFGRARLIHTQHSFVYVGGSAKYRWYGKIFSFFADEIAVVSEETRKTYLDLGVPEHKLHLIPNGVSFLPEKTRNLPERMASRIRLANSKEAPLFLKDHFDDFWILYLARVHGKKGQDRALELWEQLNPSLRSGMVLIFVGPETEPGELALLESKMARAPDCARVLYAGSSRAPKAWLSACDAFLSCSEYEGMPLGPIEAIGSGVPAVLSRIAGHDFLRASAEQYPLDHPAEGAKKIEQLFNLFTADPGKYRAEAWLRGEGVRNAFTLKAMSHEYEKLYAGAAALSASEAQAG